MSDRTVQQHAEAVREVLAWWDQAFPELRPSAGSESVYHDLDTLARLAADTERLREALEACYADLLRYAPAHWRNQGKGEILARAALASPPADTEQHEPEMFIPPDSPNDFKMFKSTFKNVKRLPADTEQP